MPNWCENDLKITGKKKDVNTFLQYCKEDSNNLKKYCGQDEEAAILDFNKFIPYPKKYSDQDEKARQDKTGKTKDGYNQGGYEWCNTNWGCYDDETEVLTTHGWKLFKDTTNDDLFFTLGNRDTIELHKRTRYIEKEVPNRMFSFKTTQIDLLVTPEHRMYVSGPKYGRYKFVPAIEAAKLCRVHIKTGAKWLGQKQDYFTLLGAKRGSYHRQSRNIKMESWLSFLGWYLSEGCLNKRPSKRGGHQYYVRISQKKYIKNVLNLLSRLPFKYYYYPPKPDVIINDFALYSYLERFGKCNEKFIPQEIKHLPKTQLQHLFNALMLGDGTQPRHGKQSFVYYTTSKILADDIQELSLKLGFSARIGKDDRRNKHNTKGYKYNHITYIVSITQPSPRGTQVKGMETRGYNGNVYCVEVPNHILYVRRNGKACWCGNTKWNANDASLFVTKTGRAATVSFSTAWSPPEPVIVAMSKKFPTLTFTLKYYEGGMCYKGKLVCTEGEIVESKSNDYSGNRGG